MYFSKAIVQRHALRNSLVRKRGVDDYFGHKLMWSLFADHPERDRDFIYRWDTDTRRPIAHIVSHREPVDREGNFELRSKPYEPIIDEGMHFLFSLRANPVIKRRDEKGKQHVHDVVMDAKTKLRDAGEWDDRDFTLNAIAQEEGFAWLDRRQQQYGFKISADAVRAENYRRRQFTKGKNGRKVTFATLDLVGHLTVVDDEKFKDALFQGIGPSKAFGCGLMMLRPA